MQDQHPVKPLANREVMPGALVAALARITLLDVSL
jgi:hypothetical protein